ELMVDCHVIPQISRSILHCEVSATATSLIAKGSTVTGAEAPNADIRKNRLARAMRASVCAMYDILNESSLGSSSNSWRYWPVKRARHRLCQCTPQTRYTCETLLSANQAGHQRTVGLFLRPPQSESRGAQFLTSVGPFVHEPIEDYCPETFRGDFLDVDNWVSAVRRVVLMVFSGIMDVWRASMDDRGSQAQEKSKLLIGECGGAVLGNGVDDGLGSAAGVTEN